MGILNFVDLVFLGYFVVVDFVYLFLLILGTVKIFLRHKEIRGIYRSQKYPQLIVLDKAHGKKFDTLNAGVNACSQPFFIATDADTLFENQIFEALVRPILASSDTI